MPVVTFTFGIPEPKVIAALKNAGSLVGQTITSAAEARLAAEHDVDVVVVQAAAAGGHSGILTPDRLPAEIPLPQLLAEVGAVTSLPLIGAGGIGTPDDVAAALEAGAIATAVGTVLLRSKESGTSAPYRAALADPGRRPTLLTRAFTGRPARGLANVFTDRYTAVAPEGYPAIHFLTSPVRKAAAGGRRPRANQPVGGHRLSACHGRARGRNPGVIRIESLTRGDTMQRCGYVLPQSGVCLDLWVLRASVCPYIPIVDIDGRHVFAVCAGSGEPVLLLHGFPQSASCWRHQIPALAESHHVVAPDWPGFGRSDPPSTAPTYDNEVERIERFVQRLGWQRFNLFAHDYGGFIGLGYAIRHPERVQRLALLNTRAHGIFRPWFYRFSLCQHWIAACPALSAAARHAPLRALHHRALGPLPRQRLFRHRPGSRIPGLDGHTARQTDVLGILRALPGARRPLAIGATGQHPMPDHGDLGRPRSIHPLLQPRANWPTAFLTPH